MRVTGNNNDLRNPIIADRMWLNVKSNSYSNASNLAVVFTDAATTGVDAKFDTERLATVVSMYTQIDSDQGYTIQSREAFTNGATVAAGFSSLIDEDNSSYTVTLSNRSGDNMMAATIYLIDNVTNVTTDLTEGSYTFTSAKGNFPNRFIIVFENEALGTNDVALETVAIYPNPAQDRLNISSPNALISNVQVTDIRGVVVINQKVSQQNITTIDVSNLSSAVYFVTMNTDKGSLTKRFIKE